MSAVATYLNFAGRTEEAFEFYRSAFDTEFASPMMRMGDVPPSPTEPPVDEADAQLVSHVALPILGGHMLMGTDIVESMGQTLTQGDNVHIMLMPDSREEADDLFAKLSSGGEVYMPLTDMFWGDYFGSFRDQFGVGWMFNVTDPGAA